MNVTAVWSLLQGTLGNLLRAHLSLSSGHQVVLSCSVFGSSALRGFYEFDLIHIDFLSLSHRFTFPLNRRWFESLKGRCFLKSPLPSHTSHTLSGSTTSRVREDGKHSTPALFSFTLQSPLFTECKSNIYTRDWQNDIFSSLTSCLKEVLYNQADFGFCFCRKSVVGRQQCNLRKLIDPWDRKNSEFRNP